MGHRNITFVENEFFHVYNRGNSKQDIFLNTSDYKRFLMLLYLSNTSMQFNIRDILKNNNDVFQIERPDALVKIGAYCLMPNHFHMILSPISEGGLSKFMLKLATAYSMYFNTKYERSGSLFEGRFKAKHADNDEYLKYLFTYIHLNPFARTKESNALKSIAYSTDAFKKASTYPYSSLAEYLSPRTGLGLVNTEVFDMYFEKPGDIKHEIFDWLQYEESALGPA